ncbi:MAG: hypothetical protein H6Q14_1494 [Bacteroidetes bacterium]|nr:hypothetical protein [Bacteroidota bacterium]
MKKGIRHFIRKYFQKRSIIQASNQKRIALFQTFDKIRTVAILGKPAQLEDLNLVAQDLKNSGKIVSLFLILSSAEVEKTEGMKERLLPECYLIDPTEFSWKGRLADSNKNKFLQMDCDVVLDFASNDIRFHQLLLSHPCRFRIGLVSCGYPLYDFCILKDDAQPLIDVYRQIKKYLSSIRQAQ